MFKVKIILNDRIEYKGLDQIIKSFEPILKEQSTTREVELDLSMISFVEPAGVVLLSNIIKYLENKNYNLNLYIPENIGYQKHCPHEYLDDSQFYSHFTGESIKQNASPRSTTLPLYNIKTEATYSWLKTSFRPWLSRNMGVDILQLGTFSEIISEVFNNISDHSEENNGFIFAQYYPNNNNVLRIAISDFGVGIPRTMRRVFPSLSDGELISQALQRNITSQSTPRNRGIGLDTLVYNTVVNSNGTVKIRSNYGEVIINPLKDGSRKVLIQESNYFYPGTFIELELSPMHLVDELEEEDFTW